MLTPLEAVARGRHRRLVDQVLEIGAREAGRAGGDGRQIDIGGERHLLAVHLEDREARRLVRQLERDVTIEAAGPEQGRVEHVRPVGRGEHDHRLVPGEAVHLREDLVEGLLALVMAAAEPGAAHPPDRVELVDEDDRGRAPLGLLEHLAHPRGADPDEHLDELRGRDVEERHAGFAGKRARQKGLAGARRADQQNAVGRLGAELSILVGRLQELDQLGHLALGVVLPGDVGEGHLLRPLLLLPDRAREEVVDALAAERAADGPAHATEEPEVDADQDDPGQERIEQPRDARRLTRLALDLHAVLFEQRVEVRILDRGHPAQHLIGRFTMGADRGWLDQLDRDLVAAERDVRDLAFDHQLLELAVRDLAGARLQPRRGEQEEQDQAADQRKGQPLGHRSHSATSSGLAA